MAKKHTKKALFTSVMSLVLCCAMLIGTTFAWFTDSVTSGVNQINAGNLDVELLRDGKAITENDKLFLDVDQQEITWWEPGVVAYTNVRVNNAGTLALKYNMTINVTQVNKTVDKGLSLCDVLKVAVVEGGVKGTTREDVLAEAEKAGSMALTSFFENGELYPEGSKLGDTQSKVYGLIVYWSSNNTDEFDNQFNMNNGKKTDDDQPLHITLGVNLTATQLQGEVDSFGPDYDKGAAWTGSTDINWYIEGMESNSDVFVIDTAEELAGLAAIVNGTATTDVTTYAAEGETVVVQDTFAGKTVKLGANIDLQDVLWTPIGRIGETSTDFTYAFKGTFDGQGNIISNLNVSNNGWAGLFGLAHSATIENVKINGVTIRSNRMAGSVVGQLYGSVHNCHAANVNIVVVPDGIVGSYDNGDKVGGIVGWLGDNGNNRMLTNCSVTEADITAYRDIGGIAGYVASSTTVSANKITDVTITVDQVTNHYENKDQNAGSIYGRTGGDINYTQDNTGTASFGATYQIDGLTLSTNSDNPDAVTLYVVPESYASETVNVPEGVTNIGGLAFAYNANIEKIVLPKTVKTLNDRAFRDTSASEVILNDGLENISYQAFRNASNIKSVNIPSSVKTISKEAFQNSGVTELVIPATVTTIEYGGLRDMKMLETVTIKGNVDIPVYAFRACTNLKTVILEGEDVTFGGGSRGMIFTNKENGDGSAITVYVANDTVKERLLAADTAAKDYGGYKIAVGTRVESAEDLTKVLEKGNNVVLTNDVSMEAATTAPYGNKYAVKLDGGVLDGNGNELYMECYGDDYGIMTSGGTVKNLTIKEGCRAVMIMSPTKDIILDNVNIGGDGVLYPINTGEAGSADVNLIVTNSTLAGWTSYGLIKSASFTNVTFKQGTYYNNIYGRVLKPYVNTTLTNCSFVEHMNLDLSALTNGHKITMTNCTVNGQVVTENVFTVPSTDAEYDTALFTVDLPTWATSIADCISFS